MRKETLAEKAYRCIKEWVLSGDAEFGMIIDQQNLADKFGFSSITPVREALILLQKDNLVDIIPRKGIFVSRMSLEAVLDNFQLREIIEPTVLERTALNIPKEVLAHYRELYTDWSAYPEKVVMKEYLDTDSEFHKALLAPLQNRALNNILETIYVENTRYRLLSIKHRDFGGSMTEHLLILDALDRGDVSLSVARLREHLQKSKLVLIDEKSL